MKKFLCCASLSLLGWAFSSAQAQTNSQLFCTNPAFTPVRPVYRNSNSPNETCVSSKWDTQRCSIKNSFNKLDRTTQDTTKYSLQTIQKNDSKQYQYASKYIDILNKSDAIHEMLLLRNQARKIANLGACETNYVYFGEPHNSLDSAALFGVGPAFISGNYFLVDKTTSTSNFMVAEDAQAPWHIPIALLSKDALLEGNYFDIVMAHEIAHGLMQDLYGVENFKKLEALSISRDGHFASAVTDPTLAWIEGFAEGFEAYLAEKYMTQSQLQVPFLEELMQNTQTQTKFFGEYGWVSFFRILPETIFRTAKTAVQMGHFTTDFLKAERIAPIRNNEYILQGNFVNLAHKYELATDVGEDLDVIADWSIERSDSLWSKEGIIAHFIYTALKNDLAQLVFKVVHWGKPKNFWDFALDFRELLQFSSTAQRMNMLRVYKSIFHKDGRELTVDYLQKTKAAPNEVLRLRNELNFKLDKLPDTNEINPPADLWLEFWTSSYIRTKVYGRMDRININSAPPSRITSLLKALGVTNENVPILRNELLRLREQNNFTSVQQLVSTWRNQHILQPHGEIPLERSTISDFSIFTERLLRARSCFVDRCLSNE